MKETLLDRNSSNAGSDSGFIVDAMGSGMDLREGDSDKVVGIGWQRA